MTYVLLNIGTSRLRGPTTNLECELGCRVAEETPVRMLCGLWRVGRVEVGGRRERGRVHYRNWDVVFGDWVVEEDGRGRDHVEGSGTLHCEENCERCEKSRETGVEEVSST